MEFDSPSREMEYVLCFSAGTDRWAIGLLLSAELVYPTCSGSLSADAAKRAEAKRCIQTWRSGAGDIGVGRGPATS